MTGNTFLLSAKLSEESMVFDSLVLTEPSRNWNSLMDQLYCVMCCVLMQEVDHVKEATLKKTEVVEMIDGQDEM